MYAHKEVGSGIIGYGGPLVERYEGVVLTGKHYIHAIAARLGHKLSHPSGNVENNRFLIRDTPYAAVILPPVTGIEHKDERLFFIFSCTRRNSRSHKHKQQERHRGHISKYAGCSHIFAKLLLFSATALV